MNSRKASSVARFQSWPLRASAPTAGMNGTRSVAARNASNHTSAVRRRGMSAASIARPADDSSSCSV
eukprot:6794578-Prymnesium_polylepis.1